MTFTAFWVPLGRFAITRQTAGGMPHVPPCSVCTAACSQASLRVRNVCTALSRVHPSASLIGRVYFGARLVLPFVESFPCKSFEKS